MSGIPATGQGRRFGRLGRTVLCVVALGVVAACSSYEKLDQQAVDEDYQVFSVTHGRGGDLKLFLIKAFEYDGKTAMCGGFTKGNTALSSNMGRNWADVSQVYLDDVKLGNADFLVEMPIYLRIGDDPKEIWTKMARERPATNCVKTDVDWRPSFEQAKFERKGPNRITGFD